jgi:hypothetical protein
MLTLPQETANIGPASNAAKTIAERFSHLMRALRESFPLLDRAYSRPVPPSRLCAPAQLRQQIFADLDAVCARRGAVGVAPFAGQARARLGKHFRRQSFHAIQKC